MTEIATSILPVPSRYSSEFVNSNSSWGKLILQDGGEIILPKSIITTCGPDALDQTRAVKNISILDNAPIGALYIFGWDSTCEEEDDFQVYEKQPSDSWLLMNPDDGLKTIKSREIVI